MQRFKIKQSKYLRLFIRKSVKYYIILLFIIVLTIPLVLTSYQQAKKNTINNSCSKLVDGILSLESQIMKLQGISNILLSDKNFSQLLLMKGFPGSENYVNINAVQQKLRDLCLEQDFLSNVYILFKDNPVFISNYISSDDFRNVYPRFLNYKNKNLEQWYQESFNNRFVIKFLPQKQIYSGYYDNNYFDGISCVINNSLFGTINSASTIISIIDTKNIINSMLDKDIRENGFAYIVDNEGNIIFRHNYEKEYILENQSDLNEVVLNSKKYLLITAESTKLGLYSVAGIPVDIFQKNVASMTSLVIVYSIAGIFLILIASLYFSIKETISMRELIDAASNTSHTAFNNKNDEYSFINNVIRQIGNTNAEQLSYINTLSNSIKGLVLENLFTLGVYTKKEEDEILRYFNNNFQLFCVTKLQIHDHASELLCREIISEIENAIKVLINNQYVLIKYHHDEIILVIFFDETENFDVEIKRDELRDKLLDIIHVVSNSIESHPVINMGVSMIVSGVKKARDAYLQASYAINMNQNLPSNEVYLYNTPRSSSNKRIFDIGELLKLYNVILSGDKKIIYQIFSNMFEAITKCYLDEQEQLQVFFTLRQTVYNAFVEVTGSCTEKVSADVSEIPEYIPGESLEKQFNELMEFAINLSGIIDANKKSNNEKLKTSIIDYIQMNYYNVNLTAEKIAEEMLISEKYVFSFIKEQTGKSLGKYIEDIRISKAEEYLSGTEYTNKKIAQVCGFGSEITFYRAFSKKHGISPTVWRESNVKTRS